jgi:hypothetical protein
MTAPASPPKWAVETAVERMGEALFYFSGRMKMAGVFAAGSELTDANAASYERVVLAWQKLTEAIERNKLPAWDHYAEEPVTSDTVPRDVAESWKAKAENYAVERDNFLTDLADMMNNHVDNWPSFKKLKTAIALIDKTLQASRDEARLCVPRAEYDRVVEANGILEDALQEAGDDYPGSSMQEWCQQQIKLARQALANPEQQA